MSEAANFIAIREKQRYFLRENFLFNGLVISNTYNIFNRKEE